MLFSKKIICTSTQYNCSPFLVTINTVSFPSQTRILILYFTDLSKGLKICHCFTSFYYGIKREITQPSLFKKPVPEPRNEPIFLTSQVDTLSTSFGYTSFEFCFVPSLLNLCTCIFLTSLQRWCRNRQSEEIWCESTFKMYILCSVHFKWFLGKAEYVLQM